MKTGETVYSLDEYIWGTYEDIVSNLPSGTYTVYQGTAVTYLHEDFLRTECIIDGIQNEAHDTVGDCSDDYLTNIPTKKHEELNEVICKWLNENLTQPDFYRVKGCTEKIVKIEDTE